MEARDLDDIYHIFNGYHEPYIGTFQGHSLSVSDVVEVLGDIPEMYGRVDYLSSNGEVGEEYWIATKEAYDREIYDSIDCGRPFTPHILEGQHITLVEPGCHFCDSFGWVKCENFDTSECEDTDGEFCGLTEGQVQKYKEMFAEPEDISPEEVEASIRFLFSPW